MYFRHGYISSSVSVYLLSGIIHVLNISKSHMFLESGIWSYCLCTLSVSWRLCWQYGGEFKHFMFICASLAHLGLQSWPSFFFQFLQSLILHLCNAFFFVSCLLSINVVMYFLFSRVFLQEFFQPTNGELQKWKVKWEFWACALSSHGCLLSLCLHGHVYSTRVSSNFYLYYTLVEYA